MSNGNAHKKFTASGNKEAEELLERVLLDIGSTLSGTGLCVCLGGSYGRGDGGVRQDRENGILYNDLDFFVFARKYSVEAEKLLKEIAGKYGKELKVDVDFSRIMSVDDIKNNASRLMMQELKRGYHLVCGEDLPDKYLPKIPAEKLPYSEACRLLLNRGMGLLMAGEKISQGSAETDFILRNIYKAVLGAGDAILIASGQYRWQLADRVEAITASDIPANWKNLYAEAVEFKSSPHRQPKADMISFWHCVRDFFQAAIIRCAGENDLPAELYRRSSLNGETAIKNFIKYCVKNRTLPLKNWKYYAVPTVVLLVNDVHSALDKMPENGVWKSKLYQQWLIFN